MTNSVEKLILTESYFLSFFKASHKKINSHTTDTLQKIMKFHHILCSGNFGETDTFPIISQIGNGNVRFP